MSQPYPRPDPWPRAAVRALARPLAWALLLCVAGAATWTTSARAQAGDALTAQVEVLRTAHGVPHIYADTFEAARLRRWGTCRWKTNGERVPLGLLRARGGAGAARGPRGTRRGFREGALLPAGGGSLLPGCSRTRATCTRASPPG